MQIFFWYWYESTESLLNVSTYANRTLHALRSWDGDRQIYTATEQDPQLRKMVISYFQRKTPEWKTESFHTTGRQKKFDYFSVAGSYSHCNTVAEAVRCSFTYAPVSKYVLLPLKKISNAVLKKPDELRRNFIKQKGFSVNDMWECERWRLYKTGTILKEHIREIFPYRGSLAEYQLLEEIKTGELFGYVQCNKENPNKLKPHFSFFPSFKNTIVNRKDIGNLKKQYAEEEGRMFEPQKS